MMRSIRMKCIKKNNIIRTVSLLLVMFILLTGCGRKNKFVGGGETLFSFGGNKVSFGETYIYAQTVIDNYKKTYGDDIFETDVETSDGSTAPLADVTRKDVIDSIIRVKVLNSKADDYKLDITNEDKELALNEANAFWDSLTDQQRTDMQLNQTLVQGVMTENLVADAVYNAVIADVDDEISDEEARETSFFDMYFPCYEVGKYGTIKEFDEERKKEQYGWALDAYEELTQNGGDSIEALAAEYELDQSSHYTMTPEEIKETYGETICSNLYELEDNTFSTVMESEYGYHIFYMEALTDREATDVRKEEILSERRDKYFNEKYKSWRRSMDRSFNYDKSVNQELYSQIKFE